MSNSNLVSYTKLSPNCNKPRNHKIDTITIHHMAGNLSVEDCGEIFARAGRQASSNYGIGTDGRVALYVDEANRAWTSSSPENDNRAVTIEVANDGGAPYWHVSDKAMESLIRLCVDICKRNGIERLNYTGDKSGNLTMHKWFAATACPGPYLSGEFPFIAREVNRRLNLPQTAPSVSTSKPTTKEPTEALARDVIAGKWGNGLTRRARLTAEGYDPDEVQALVNKLLTDQPAKKSTEEIAREVIAGKWGNGTERFSRLIAAGYNPAVVQVEVNKLLKE